MRHMEQTQYSKKPIIFLCFFMVLLCLQFWMSSRYPELQAKSVLGNQAPLSSLGFETLIEIESDDPVLEQILWGAVNWAYTNKKGMSFAFLFGAFILTLLPFLKQLNFKNRFKSSVLGMFIGAPLGVCVNCAAPIAYSMHLSGARLPASLSAMIASPTLNIIVVTMMFAIFPFYLAVTKLAFTFLFMLVIIPLSCRFFFTSEEKINQGEKDIDNDSACEVIQQIELPYQNANWIETIVWSVKNYFKNLFYIVRLALPLMILAGLIGSIAMTLMPWSNISNGNYNIPASLIILIAIGISFIGVMVPSPMAFDVILASVMLQSGVPIALVAILLFTLGTYSIYAFFIIWKSLSFRLASYLYLVTVILSLSMGGYVFYMDRFVFNNSEELLVKISADTQIEKNQKENQNSTEKISSTTNSQKTALEYKDIKKQITPLSFQRVQSDTIPTNLTIQSSEFLAASTNNEVKFNRLPGNTVGIVQPYEISNISGIPDSIIQSTMAIASADVHNDGWPDLLILDDYEYGSQIKLYANINGQGFQNQAIPLPTSGKSISAFSFIDLNADGWLDIVFANHHGTLFQIINQEGEFTENSLSVMLDLNAGKPMSLAFADIGGDGDIDIFVGNWNVGPNFINYSKSRNKLLIAENDSYEIMDLPEFTGETLSSLFHDFNDDGVTDLYVGNDFLWNDRSDLLFIGSENQHLQLAPMELSQKLYGGQTTMSIDTGDINNDGEEEIYIGHIAYTGHFHFNMSRITDRQIRYNQYCEQEGYTGDQLEQCNNEYAYKFALLRVSHFVVDACDRLKNPSHKQDCLNHLINWTKYCSFHFKNSRPKKNVRLYNASRSYEEQCEGMNKALLERGGPRNNELIAELTRSAIPTANTSVSNILLKQNKQTNSFEDIAITSKVGYGAWTWNARFADLDNDSWQDIYLVNGYSFTTTLPSNLFYRNTGEGIFNDETEKLGLLDFTPTSAFSFTDLDHDGDLDIVNVPTDADVRIYKNNAAGNKSIIFSLRDQSNKNTYAIGAQIKIIYQGIDGAQKQQTRTIKGSGGFRSFSPYEAHFGLADISRIKQVIISWPDGSTQKVDYGFEAGHSYIITRQ